MTAAEQCPDCRTSSAHHLGRFLLYLVKHFFLIYSPCPAYLGTHTRRTDSSALNCATREARLTRCLRYNRATLHLECVSRWCSLPCPISKMKLSALALGALAAPGLLRCALAAHEECIASSAEGFDFQVRLLFCTLITRTRDAAES